MEVQASFNLGASESSIQNFINQQCHSAFATILLYLLMTISHYSLSSFHLICSHTFITELIRLHSFCFVSPITNIQQPPTPH